MSAAVDTTESRLLELLKLVNDWLKFAEAKNVGIVGLASGAMSVLLVALGFLREAGLTFLSSLVVSAGAACLAVSLLIGVYSFFPATAMPRWMRMQLDPPRPDDNLYFFGHAAKYDPVALAFAVARRYGRTTDPIVHELHTDLAAQLIVNARITMQKLRLFRWSVLFFGAGVMISGVGMLLIVAL
ncbi:MAG TPA: Pycsar system effector family protein [Thermomicrobiales bacterium]|nr:Pycsar system effector family protein [Thermomicrobiales bacterium]